MFDSQVFAFMIVAAVLTITPGADTMLVLRNVIRGSRKDGIATTFGICSGLFVHALLSGLGVSIILMHSAALFHVIKTVGAFYLVWLGFQSIRSAVKSEADDDKNDENFEKLTSVRKCLTEGFFTNVLNPKVAIFYLAFLPQFIGPGDNVIIKSMILASIHYIMAICWLCGLSAFLDKSRRFVEKASVRRMTEGFCGMILVGLGIRLMLEKR
ncbi:LysE family translocator [Desulfobacterales bacterium HSG16]|nr:LysE family translocator [Desulfobacterales bacterium HSG16]